MGSIGLFVFALVVWQFVQISRMDSFNRSHHSLADSLRLALANSNADIRETINAPLAATQLIFLVRAPVTDDRLEK